MILRDRSCGRSEKKTKHKSCTDDYFGCCVRYQHYFINHIFTYEINELRSEGIRCPKVEYTNNDKQVELLLGSPGIFEVLDEQTKVPNSTDKTAILKMHAELSTNPSYDNIRSSPVSFKIKHYAGDVEYQVAGMLEKNRNTPSLGVAGTAAP